ncbi:MFS transporter [Alginatibacterium sediminis]|uniref:MFS transporter n=1 Tax=Alginatibacterium sediminis TaxID=2164068 RepID=A0A420EHY8_9ALTE|nr:MFS transporter [Alginatibacterium sediminis]RKF20274.1 MFS transporter [Alginatibacterium sediminis]
MNNRLPLLFSILLISSSQLTNGLLSPALPQIAEQFAVSQSLPQQIIVQFLLGLGLSQLIYGPLADSLGRRYAFWLGQFVFLLGTSIMISGSGSIQMLIIGAFVQGLGAGSNQILARCLLSDNYRGPALDNSLAWLGMAASCIPIMAPLLGGFVTEHGHWSWLMFAMAAASLSLCLFSNRYWRQLSETRKPRSLKDVFVDYLDLIRNREFLLHSSIFWIAGVGIIYMMTSAPFILQHHYHLSASDYGLTMMLPAFGLAFGSNFNRIGTRLSDRQRSYIAGSAPAIAAIMLKTNDSLAILLLALSLTSFAIGVLFPLGLKGLLNRFRHQAGTASALAGASQMLLTAIITSSLNQWVDPSVSALALSFLCMSALLAIVISLQLRPLKMASQIEAS